ncbi:hypothetical protein J6590_056501 [Homalodisca vitripennis]|nr:hypothetical protein J6590_056501 [Homalodisca vitripennis]
MYSTHGYVSGVPPPPPLHTPRRVTGIPRLTHSTPQHPSLAGGAGCLCGVQLLSARHAVRIVPQCAARVRLSLHPRCWRTSQDN